MAQDWLIVIELIPHRASAVGFVMALQFGPQLASVPWHLDHVGDNFYVGSGHHGVLTSAMAIGTTIGAPIVGEIADRLGLRWAVDLGSLSGFVAALVGLREWHVLHPTNDNVVALRNSGLPDRPPGDDIASA